MTLAIEVTDLQVRYGETVALHGLDFQLAGGGIYGLVGRNGSGKTSLLSTLAGFRKPSAGTVRIAGQPVFENPQITRQVCLIRDTGEVGDKSDTVKDALDVVRRLRPNWDADYAAKLVDLFALPQGKKIKSLSRGQRSALGILVGLAARTPVTMLDEAHLGMDAPTRQSFQDELLRDFMAHPRTIIVSTHLIEEQSPLFERILILHEGRLLLHEDLDELRSRGVSVTGPTEAVEAFVAGRTVLGDQRLGRTRSATLYGALDDADRRAARQAGLDVGPVAVQDLFTHLTQPTGAHR